MPTAFTLHGVPTSILQDGWWLNCNSPNGTDSVNNGGQDRTSGLTGMIWRQPLGLIALILLILLGDLLFWGYDPGSSLAIFATAIFAVSTQFRTSDRNPIMPTLIAMLSTLPVIEHLQFLSVALMLAGLLTSVAWLRAPKDADGPTMAAAIIGMTEWAFLAGVKLLSEITKTATKRARQKDGSAWPFALQSHLRNWAFPLGGTLVLAALLVSANPVLEHNLAQLMQFDLDLVRLLRRILFWFGLAMIIVPFLTLPEPGIAGAPVTLPQAPRLGLNPGSVLRALILFNLVLGVQSALDMSILFGEANLPPGMSLATYAHRGAYPLLATAMLAGGFALIARPFLAEHKALKPLMLLWLGQNVLLGLTSALRLNFYVETFGVTYLRLYATIWMGLVVVGLLLTGWQILRGRPNGWLLARSAALGIATLYLCSFVNFAGIIATTNLNHERVVDWSYLCSLGPTAGKAVSLAAGHVPGRYRDCWALPAQNPNWREWGFRTWRMRGYALTGFEQKAHGDEDTVGR